MNSLPTRSNLLELVPKGGTVLELGVFLGDFAREILATCEPETLFLVDRWTGTAGSGDKDGNNHVNVDNMESVYVTLCARYATDPRVRLVRSDTETFLRRWHARFFDMIYVDADHSYEAVMSDLTLALPLVKPGGWLMGHDYCHGAGVAVDDFCRTNRLLLEHITRDGCPSFAIRNSSL